jgi:hypothetical protein
VALSQVLWSLDSKQLLTEAAPVNEQELEDALHTNIGLLDPNWLVIGRQVKTSNGKFLDLLCMDRDEDLVVVELKKDVTPREVTAQVIEYASYMTEQKSEDLGKIYADYSAKYLGHDESLNEAYRKKFGADLDDELVNQKVRMVIVAAKMDDGTEHIIQYLRNTYDVDINILFFQVFQHGNDRLLSRVWFQEDMELDETPRPSGDWNGEFYISFGSGERHWEDAVKYGFISAGGGSWYTKTLKKLHAGDRIWVNIPHTGYVGVGTVTGESVQASQAVFNVDGENRPMLDLDLLGNYFYSPDDPSYAEYIVPVNWIKTFPENRAVKEIGFFGNQNTVCCPETSKWQYTVERLKKLWNIPE